MLPHVCLHWALEAFLFTQNLAAATCRTYAVLFAAHLRRMTCGDNLLGVTIRITVIKTRH